MKLSDRMLRVSSFTDARLLTVSPEARLFALCLDAVAETTGVLSPEPGPIRSAFGYFLARDEVPPALEQIEQWITELEDARYLLRYRQGAQRLAYLHGFGNRQTGRHVNVGFSTKTGETAPHLPLPLCVELEPAVEDNGTVRIMLPRHCAGHYSGCPCERYAQGTGTLPEPLQKGERKGGKTKGETKEGIRTDPKGTQRQGGRDAGKGDTLSSDSEAAEFESLCAQLGDDASKVIAQVKATCNSQGTPYTDKTTNIYLRAALQERNGATA